MHPAKEKHTIPVEAAQVSSLLSATMLHAMYYYSLMNLNNISRTSTGYRNR